MEVLLANPRGFCAGVDRAIEIVERALAMLGPPVYVRHEVVHNRFVVDGLRAKGAVFVEDLDDVPDGAVVIFSAHGVSRAVRDSAARRGLTVLDATCPLVTKVHLEVARNGRRGFETILIGHRGHPEVVGTMGQYQARDGADIHLVETVADAETVRVNDPDKVALVTQTTLSMDDTADIVALLEKRFPNVRKPRRDDICYATQNRQNAVKQLVETCDLVLIVGSRNSSNSNRLLEIALKRGVEAYLIDGAAEIRREWLAGKRRIGLSAGASAPETLVREVVRELQKRGAHRVGEAPGIEERVTFPLPKELRNVSRTT